MFEFSLGAAKPILLKMSVILHKLHTTEFICVLKYYPQNAGDSIELIHIFWPSMLEISPYAQLGDALTIWSAYRLCTMLSPPEIGYETFSFMEGEHVHM